MTEKNCSCEPGRPGSCPSCFAEQLTEYWCETCRLSVPEKRCPHCGLKTKKKRQKS